MLKREKVLKAIEEFEQFGIREGYVKPNKYYFRFRGKDILYPRKYIVLRARELQGLDNANYTTEQAKSVLTSLFANDIEHIDINKEKIQQRRELFIEIAKSYNMRYQKSEAAYFQIYPNNIPEEGSAGTHYEFISRHGLIRLEFHVESRGKLNTKDRAILKEKIRDITKILHIQKGISYQLCL